MNNCRSSNHDGGGTKGTRAHISFVHASQYANEIGCRCLIIGLEQMTDHS